MRVATRTVPPVAIVLRVHATRRLAIPMIFIKLPIYVIARLASNTSFLLRSNTASKEGQLEVTLVQTAVQLVYNPKRHVAGQLDFLAI
jgi:hypothetical protein